MRERVRKLFPAVIVLLVVVVLMPAARGEESEDWADSPEAYFLTTVERAEWTTLKSQAERTAFKARYWLRRDPTPETRENEFRDLVAGRIKIANERFAIGDTEGARTARGLAFVVFGSPSVTKETPVPRPGSYPATGSNVPPQVRIGGNDGLETVIVWKYEKSRTPRILKLLDRPTLELIFYIEPERKRDRFDIEQLARDLQMIVAERSIVNPDMREPGPLAEAPTFNIPIASQAGELSAQATSALQSGSTNDRVQFGYASLLEDRQIAAWFFVPDGVRIEKPTIVGRILSDADSEVARISLAVTPTTELFAAEKGKSFGVRIPMPDAGSYQATFALTDGSRTVTTGRIAKLVIPPVAATDLQISNLVISGGFGPVTSTDAAFAWGSVRVMPRSDATFRFNESLWYFIQVAHPSSPDGLVIEMRLRKNNAQYGQPTRVAAEAGEISDGFYLIGREIPLMAFDPGNYSLYVTVIDGTTEKVARADFKVLGP